MYLNLRRIDKRLESIMVLAFGALYSMAIASLFIYNEEVKYLSLVFNFIGAAILNELFWKNFIGSKINC